MQWSSEKWATRGLLGVIAYAAIRSLAQASAKPFWYDELCTVFVSRIPSVSVMWSALQKAADSQPPPYYVVERLALSLGLSDALAFRLPSLLAFCCTVICVFVCVRRRASGTVALLCATVPLLSVLFFTYAAEARGYSLMVAGFALALVCYQRANSFAWTMLMALSLAAATAFHYYAIFVVIPFALAEFTFTAANRRLRFAVWLALAACIAPLVWFWPFVAGMKQYYGAHFVAPASLSTALTSYGWFFQFPAHWGLALFATTLVIMLRRIIAPFRNLFAPASWELVHEDVLLCGLLLLPLCIFAAMKLTHGGLNNRYMLPAMLAFPLVLGRVLGRLQVKTIAVVGAVLFVALVFQEAVFWRDNHRSQISPAQAIQDFVVEAGHSDLPVMVSNGQDYLQLAYYSTPQSITRFASVVDPRASAAFSEGNTADLQLLLLRSYRPLQVSEFDDFAAKHPEFLLYSRDWWPGYLLRDGYTLELLAHRESVGVYLVRRTSAGK